MTVPFAMLALYQSGKAGMERFSDALRDEVRNQGIRVTMVRAGQMIDADYQFDMDPSIAQEFMQENFKRGIDMQTRAISPFTAVAGLFRTLIDLPPEINVPEIMLEARHS